MQRRKFLGSGASALAVAALSACVPATDTAYGVSYYEPYPDPAFAYQYYPSANVYYHAPSRSYYYPVGGRWHRSRRLPAHFRLHERDRHVVHVRDRHPYYRNDEHRRRFSDRRDNDRRDRERREAERREAERSASERDRRRPDDDRRRGNNDSRRERRGDERPAGAEPRGSTPRPDRGDRRERVQQPFESPLVGNAPPGPGDPGYNPRTGGPSGGGARYDPR